MKYKNILIKDNLQEGDCLLFYQVVVRHLWKTINYVCPLDKCKSFEEAIDYFLETYSLRENSVILYIEGHKFLKNELVALSRAC